MQLAISCYFFSCFIYLCLFSADSFYIVLFLLCLLLCFNLLKIWENYDSREELSKEIYENFKYVNAYHRYMRMSGMYYSDLEDDEFHSEYEKKAKQLEDKLPKYLKERLGDIPDRDFEIYYKPAI